MNNLYKECLFLNEFDDTLLMYLDKPILKIKNEEITLYHGSGDLIRNRIDNISINVGATKYSDARWSSYFWDTYDSAVAWAIFRLQDKYEFPAGWDYENSKVALRIDLFDPKKLIGKYCYVYEVKVNINDVSVGTHPSIREYTVDKPVPIYKTHKIKITQDILDKYAVMWTQKDRDEYIKKRKDGMKSTNRNFLLRNVLDVERDLQRMTVRSLGRDKLEPGKSDLTQYKDAINAKIFKL